MLWLYISRFGYYSCFGTSNCSTSFSPGFSFFLRSFGYFQPFPFIPALSSSLIREALRLSVASNPKQVSFVRWDLTRDRSIVAKQYSSSPGYRPLRRLAVLRYPRLRHCSAQKLLHVLRYICFGHLHSSVRFERFRSRDRLTFFVPQCTPSIYLRGCWWSSAETIRISVFSSISVTYSVKLRRDLFASLA